MSKNFARFAKKTTKGSFDEARKTERKARGGGLEIGTKGTGIMTIFGKDKKEKKTDDTYPIVEIIITAQTPEELKGKEVKDPLNLTWYIKDSEKPGSDWTAEDAWGAMLNDLENLGWPTELIESYEDPQELFDWCDKEPRTVHFEIIAELDDDGNQAYYRGRPSSRVVAFLPANEEEAESADDGEKIEVSDDDKCCMFRGTKYIILEELDEDELQIKNTKTGSIREVAANKVEMI